MCIKWIYALINTERYGTAKNKNYLFMVNLCSVVIFFFFILIDNKLKMKEGKHTESTDLKEFFFLNYFQCAILTEE